MMIRDADSHGYKLGIRVMDLFFILSILSSHESRFRRKSGIHTTFTHTVKRRANTSYNLRLRHMIPFTETNTLAISGDTAEKPDLQTEE